MLVELWVIGGHICLFEFLMLVELLVIGGHICLFEEDFVDFCNDFRIIRLDLVIYGINQNLWLMTEGGGSKKYPESWIFYFSKYQV